MQKNLQTLLLNIAIEAGKEIVRIYNSADLGIEIKDDNSPLTLADKAANDVILKELSAHTPYPILSEEGAKDSYAIRKKWKRFWMVDPLDGTKEFIKKNGEFTVNIALIENGKPIMGVVYAPILGDAYFGDQNGAFKYNIDLNNGNVINKKPIKVVSPKEKLIIVGSRSHMNKETMNFIEGSKKKFQQTDFISKGSSLKLVLVAEGKAHIYPRFAPTMEWDTAAGHAVVVAAGGSVSNIDGTPVAYNKENLLNPWFIVQSF